MVARSYRLRPWALLATAALLGLGLAGQPAAAAPATTAADRPAATADPGALSSAFSTAARRYDVPRDLLVAVGYAQTRLNGHAGAPSQAGGYGVMHLVHSPVAHSLDDAARLTGTSVDAIRHDDTLNIAGAAAVLRSYADEAGLTAADRAGLDRWYTPVARLAAVTSDDAARLYADEVFRLLGQGLSATTASGWPVRLASHQVSPARPAAVKQPRSTDYPPAHWVAASSSNQTAANRPTTYPIQYVVIHVTQETYADTIGIFQDPASQVSAHYVVRSSDGDITQMVREKNVAWHAGNWNYNTWSVGIEHEGWVDDPTWFTEAMYRASAALTANLCAKYGIPVNRTHIIGHSEVPGATHTDPGQYWDWAHYMSLVKS